MRPSENRFGGRKTEPRRNGGRMFSDGLYALQAAAGKYLTLCKPAPQSACFRRRDWLR
ncbi:3-methyl-2-oxobutanoate hydroxymethyltransferase [Neisseria bacilliformis ATCC BAA-1200]|uniref:3-methyl-2-oxobutanoate hydroxymethyltransferase n=1 Tax=Neisseria bacilliformis ATCC BAA-1200 TaxID=888742 RepID=F2BE20_9NEIS|nr:3-methyl-2-oxobutanoate hydroxymethyltransferase [Neisseria bacilliformis ATCC BAA-1200]